MARTASKVYEHSPMVPIQDGKLDKLIREIGINENPAETYVLVGYCKGATHKNWIEGQNTDKKMYYNIRFGNGNEVDGKMAAAKFLVLYNGQDFEHSFIYRVAPREGKVLTKKQIEETGYNYPGHELYFVYELTEKMDLGSHIFNREYSLIKEKLKELKTKKQPFVLSLIELALIRQAID
jgi:hypothetical protein